MFLLCDSDKAIMFCTYLKTSLPVKVNEQFLVVVIWAVPISSC